MEYLCLCYPCNQKTFFWNSKWKCGWIFGIPMSSVGGVHLISGIAQFTRSDTTLHWKLWYNNHIMFHSFTTTMYIVQQLHCFTHVGLQILIFTNCCTNFIEMFLSCITSKPVVIPALKSDGVIFIFVFVFVCLFCFFHINSILNQGSWKDLGFIQVAVQSKLYPILRMDVTLPCILC